MWLNLHNAWSLKISSNCSYLLVAYFTPVVIVFLHAKYIGQKDDINKK
jgi:hypothetical protein